MSSSRHGHCVCWHLLLNTFPLLLLNLNHPKMVVSQTSIKDVLKCSCGFPRRALVWDPSLNTVSLSAPRCQPGHNFWTGGDQTFWSLRPLAVCSSLRELPSGLRPGEGLSRFKGMQFSHNHMQQSRQLFHSRSSIS